MKQEFFKTTKGTELPLMMIERKKKNKQTGQWIVLPPMPYLQVAYRLVWFREDHPDWSIETDLIVHEDEKTVFKAIIKDASGKIMSTATKQENTAGFEDHLEKAETGAVGRALAMCGYGTQFAPELSEDDRFADAPIEKKGIKNHAIGEITEPPQFDTSEKIDENKFYPGDYIMPFGKIKGKMLKDLSDETLKSTLEWCKNAKNPGTNVVMTKQFIQEYLQCKNK